MDNIFANIQHPQSVNNIEIVYKPKTYMVEYYGQFTGD